jgi:outer membrane protein OmpA-like peptidoglycan-associated protein
MNTKIILVAAATLLSTGCSMFSEDEPEVEVKPPYTHPDFSVPKPSPYKEIKRSDKRVQHTFSFEFNSSKLPENTKLKIQPHVDLLISNPTRKVSIQGSADSKGGSEYNYKLGDKRAQNIADLMVELGVDASQLVVTSSGEARSLYIPNKSVVLAY